MNSQKIALFGNPGETTQRLLTEALRRGHNVTAIVADEKGFTMKHPKLKVVKGDVRKKEDVKKFAAGHDTVISVHELIQTKPDEHVNVIRAVIEGVKSAGVRNLVAVAHAFGQPTERTEEEYAKFKPVVQAQQEALKLFQKEKELQWSYAHSVKPQAQEKTGKYRSGNEVLFTSSEGQTSVPVKEYTYAVIDEAEKGQMELHQGEQGESSEF